MRLGFGTAVALILVAQVFPARAAEPLAAPPTTGQADEAQFHFQRGNRAYQEKRFEDALVSYYLSNRLVPNRNVQFNIARALHRLGRHDEAYRAWAGLLEQALPEKEQAAAREAIDELRPFLALVAVKSTPPGATIYADRRDLGALGTTPSRLALPPGSVRIILEAQGFRSAEIEVLPIRGQEIEVSAMLERIVGHIEIRHVPATAKIRRELLEGDILRVGPGPLTLLPGSQTLFVTAPGFESQRVVVQILPDATIPVDVILAPSKVPTATLVIRANIAGALIRIDGQESGFAPTVLDEIPTGAHDIEIVVEGRRPHRERVELVENQRAFIEARLAPADPEVTAATKSTLASEEAPGSISVINADTIAAMGYTTLGEALASVRGGFTSNDRSYESIGFYGFSPPGDYTKRVLVLVDGHPMNDLVTGQGYVGRDLDVDLANIARIEVVRGPGSVLYGTGALFGVVNLVTRRASEGGHGSLLVRTGSAGLASGRATASLRKGEAECVISVAGLRTDGESRFVWPAELNQGTSRTAFGSDGEQAHHVDLAARMGSFTLRAAYGDRRKEIPTGAYGTLPGPGTSHHDRRAYAELRFDRSLLGIKLAGRAAYDGSFYRGRFNVAEPDVPGQEELRAQWMEGEVRAEFPTLLHQRFTLGIEVVRHLQVETDRPFLGQPPIPLDLILSAYVVDDVRLGQRLSANLGVRADSYTKTFGTSIHPRIAIMGRPYREGSTKLFLGSAFRAPSPNERVNNPTSSLRPETIWSGELNHTHALTDELHLVGVLFAHSLQNLITLVDDPISGTIYENQPDRIRSLGIEGELRWEPGGGAKASLSLTRQRVEQLAPSGNIPFLNAPTTLAKVAVLCPILGPSLHLGSELILDSGRHFRPISPGHDAADNRVDDALLWNVTFSGEYRRLRLRYHAGIFNLLDVRSARTGYPTGIDYPLALIPRYGRTVRAGIAWSF